MRARDQKKKNYKPKRKMILDNKNMTQETREVAILSIFCFRKQIKKTS